MDFVFRVTFFQQMLGKLDVSVKKMKLNPILFHTQKSTQRTLKI